MTKISLGREVADSEQDGPYQPDPKAGRRLFQVGCVGVAALIAWNVHRSPVSDPLLLGAGVAMIALGALPSLLWALRSSTHFPVFEVFLLTFVPFYGLSLLAGHPEVMTFDDDATTGAAVAGAARPHPRMASQARPTDVRGASRRAVTARTPAGWTPDARVRG